MSLVVWHLGQNPEHLRRNGAWTLQYIASILPKVLRLLTFFGYQLWFYISAENLRLNRTQVLHKTKHEDAVSYGEARPVVTGENETYLYATPCNQTNK